MAEDWLKETLQRADRRQGGEGAAVDPQAIRARVAGQRRRGRIVQGGMLALLAVAGITTFFAVRAPKKASGPMAISVPGAVSKPAVVAELDLSVAQRIAMEAQIRLDHRRNSTQARSAGAVDLAEQRDQAARIMVFAAQQRKETAGSKDAADLYQRTIALFPETSSAGAARVALAQLIPNH